MPRSAPLPRLLPGCPRRPWLEERSGKSPRFGNESRDARGRVRVNLGIGHRFANSGGWQWRSRLVVAYALGRLPRTDEHVHHRGPYDSIEDLELLAVEYHNHLHACAATVAGYRDDLGRFVEQDEPGRPFPWPRHAAVLGPAAEVER